MKITIGILSYNNSLYTDRLVENLKSIIKMDHNMIIFDNGSHEDKISKYTTHRSNLNSRMTGGFNQILQLTSNDFDYIWLFTNDCYITTMDIDPLKNMISKMIKYPNIGILHPSLHEKVNVCYDVKNKNTKGIKIVNEYDFVCPMFSKKAIEICGNKFNSDLVCGWGLDYETSYLIRSNKMKIAINHDLIVMHNTSFTYDNGLDCTYKNRNEFYDAASKEMYSVFNAKYGSDWNYKFKVLFNEDVGEWYE